MKDPKGTLRHNSEQAPGGLAQCIGFPNTGDTTPWALAQLPGTLLG